MEDNRHRRQSHSPRQRADGSQEPQGGCMSAFRFSRVELRNWRNFSKVDVPLARRVFLVGPNASGKSNFLDVFRFLRDLVIDGGGLAKAVHARDGMSKLRSLFARTSTNVEVRVDVVNEHIGWRYELA